MVDRVVLLSARRAYEFRPDSLRLTMLSTGKVRRTIREAFDFQRDEIATPRESFGPVPPTDPPGLVFAAGSIASPDGSETPIRFLHVEVQRIVIDVAGHSAAIDAVWQAWKAALAEVRTPDDAPIFGDPVRQLDHSEITAHLAFDPERLLPPEVRGLMAKGNEHLPSDPTWGIMPSLSFRVQSPTRPYQGAGSAHSFKIEPRTGEPPAERIYYSVAPLPSEAHVAFLEDLEAAMAAPPASPSTPPTARRRARRAATD